MKMIFIGFGLIILSTVLDSWSAHAQTCQESCYTDYFGNQHCQLNCSGE